MPAAAQKGDLGYFGVFSKLEHFSETSTRKIIFQKLTKIWASIFSVYAIRACPVQNPLVKKVSKIWDML